MTRITPEHLARGIIYIRQSTNDQVLHNHESRRRQYGLVDRARSLGWAAVEVIDDDLGRSGSGISHPGFEKLLAAICEGQVGAVVSIEASRLARNGREWHTLIEFCGLVGTLIVDEDGVYDPRHPNDRLLLGMKGTMSEMELSLFRQRSLEALKQKARRGELFLTVAIGYVKTSHDRIEKDPDRRVQKAITLAFNKFAQLQNRASSPSLDAARAATTAGYGIWSGRPQGDLEAAGLQHAAPFADKLDLCRRLRLWPHRQPHHDLGREKNGSCAASAGTAAAGTF
jgi:DNA invertase Pin-like site-specific DNA recombinase